MLYHAVQIGLDMAIVNPVHITPYAEIPVEERELAEDLIFNRRSDALQRYIEHFEGANMETSRAELPVDPTLNMSPAERLHWRILHRRKEGVEEDIDEIIVASLTPTPLPVERGVTLPFWGGIGVRGKPATKLLSISLTPSCSSNERGRR